MNGITERHLEIQFPLVPWREPLSAQCVDGTSGFACRFCIALKGLRGQDIGKLPQTLSEFREHQRSEHGIEITE